MSTGRQYTNEEDLLVKELTFKGLSALEIGKVLRRTKNSILGRRYRLGLTIDKNGKRCLSPEMKVFLKDNAGKITRKQMLDGLRKKFNFKISHDDFYRNCRKLKLPKKPLPPKDPALRRTTKEPANGRYRITDKIERKEIEVFGKPNNR